MKTFRDIEEELQNLSEEELRLWNKGFLAAIEGVIEQLRDDKIRLLNKLISLNPNQHRTRLVLESRLGILDTYEDHYKGRIALLERDAE